MCALYISVNFAKVARANDKIDDKTAAHFEICQNTNVKPMSIPMSKYVKIRYVPTGYADKLTPIKLYTVCTVVIIKNPLKIERNC